MLDTRRRYCDISGPGNGSPMAKNVFVLVLVVVVVVVLVVTKFSIP